MITRSGWTGRALAAALLLALSLSVGAQESEDKKARKEPADPPRAGVYMGQLRVLFVKWDTTKDSYLDKQELAVAFRGAKAKPYDDKEARPPEKEEGDTGTSQKEKEKSGRKPDYTAFPDYNFLVQLDTDKDDQVSRAEFLSWARDYAVQLRDRDELVKKLQQSQQQTKKGGKGKTKKSLESQLKKQKQQIDQLQRKLARFAAVQKALGGR